MPSTNSIPRRIWHLAHTQSLGHQHSLHEEHHPSLHLCYYMGNTWLWWSIFDTFKGHTGSKMESLLLENNIISVYSFQTALMYFNYWISLRTSPWKTTSWPSVKPNGRWKTAREHWRRHETLCDEAPQCQVVISAYGCLRTAVQCSLHRKYLAKSIEIL